MPEDTTTGADLGPQPDPVIEPGEPNPGGADAIDDTPNPPLSRDLDPDNNPMADEAPDEVTEADDKSQAPDGDPSDSEAGTQDDVTAGQEAEDGSVEPPA